MMYARSVFIILLLCTSAAYSLSFYIPAYFVDMSSVDSIDAGKSITMRFAVDTIHIRIDSGSVSLPVRRTTSSVDTCNYMHIGSYSDRIMIDSISVGLFMFRDLADSTLIVQYRGKQIAFLREEITKICISPPPVDLSKMAQNHFKMRKRMLVIGLSILASWMLFVSATQ